MSLSNLPKLLRELTKIAHGFRKYVHKLFHNTKNSKHFNNKSCCPSQKPCPFELRKWLDFAVVVFFKNAEKMASGGLIMSLEKFDLILLYFNFLQKIFM